ncbi:hypothetical protein MHSWG343_01220 [Candidatus Mycoplasma haematohominis]|uniref:Uncharacterized protein n=1 Tax=Candidatus Mycoplasma haematohominis TaxID=1494318 RepID=A0A478FQF5_9MOLU|nr:hypothetical protein MHSWG343_01220 [Candidatus Mycoplasma haemohominis]
MLFTASKRKIMKLVLSFLTEEEIKNLAVDINGIYTFQEQMDGGFSDLVSIHGRRRAKKEIEKTIAAFRANAAISKDRYDTSGFKLVDDLRKVLFRKSFEDRMLEWFDRKRLREIRERAEEFYKLHPELRPRK